jgi:hypothetical protein
MHDRTLGRRARERQVGTRAARGGKPAPVPTVPSRRPAPRGGKRRSYRPRGKSGPANAGPTADALTPSKCAPTPHDPPPARRGALVCRARAGLDSRMGIAP